MGHQGQGAPEKALDTYATRLHGSLDAPTPTKNCVSGGPRRATRVERLEIPDSVVTGNCLISVNSSEQLIGLCGNTTSRWQAEGWEWEGEEKREKEWVHPLEHTLISSTAWNALKPLSQISQELVAMLKLRTRSDDKWAEVEVKTRFWNYRWEVCRYGWFALWLFFSLQKAGTHYSRPSHKGANLLDLRTAWREAHLN